MSIFPFEDGIESVIANWCKHFKINWVQVLTLLINKYLSKWYWDEQSTDERITINTDDNAISLSQCKGSPCGCWTALGVPTLVGNRIYKVAFISCVFISDF